MAKTSPDGTDAGATGATGAGVDTGGVAGASSPGKGEPKGGLGWDWALSAEQAIMMTANARRSRNFIRAFF
jgi:hypothetical protein